MILSITESVKRQLNEKAEKIGSAKEMASTTKNKKVIEGLDNFCNRQSAKIKEINIAYKKLEQGLMFTRHGWVERR